MAKKAKASERFTKAQAEELRQQLSGLQTVPERKAAYKKVGLSQQEVARLLLDYKLEKLPPAKPGKPGKAAAKAPKKAAAPVPAKAPKAAAKAPARAKDTSLDEDVKQLIALQARVISKLMGN
jgi:hypothetical protein